MKLRKKKRNLKLWPSKNLCIVKWAFLVKHLPFFCRSIDAFRSELIADDEFHSRAHKIGLVIAEAEKAIVCIRLFSLMKEVIFLLEGFLNVKSQEWVILILKNVQCALSASNLTCIRQVHDQQNDFPRFSSRFT